MREKINILNLFITIKSFLLNKIYPSFGLCVTIKNIEGHFVTENINKRQFLQMKIDEFES